MRPVLIADREGERIAGTDELRGLAKACSIGRWEVELGFGKGRYLLDRASRDPQVSFLGIEIAARYFHMVRDRARRRGVDNVVLLCGEAAYVTSAMLPLSFAERVHVYFPDPWPKDRHARRRMVDPDNIDLLLGLLRPGGEMLFASDHPRYGAQVESLLESHPSLDVRCVEAWTEGTRTNYEAKFAARGIPILRLVATLTGGNLRHPQGSMIETAIRPPDATGKRTANDSGEV